MNKKITNVAQERLDTVQTNIMKELDMAMRGLLLVSCVFAIYIILCVCVSVCHVMSHEMLVRSLSRRLHGQSVSQITIPAEMPSLSSSIDPLRLQQV